jgi:5-hydroxyisourate hydrolase-like protein (transthyretin family)
LVRPVVLLPARPCQDDLAAILAHELAHARGHDLIWNYAAHLTSILLWFHPLSWRIRAAHSAACDAVCDAVAADLLGDVASYGRTLARLAIRVAWPPPAHGLAMARTSDVRRRIDALDRKVFRTPLSWKLVMPALLVGSVLLLLIGGLGFTRGESAVASAPRDEQAKPKSTPTPRDAAQPADPAVMGKLTLRAVEAATGEPIEGVSISYTARIDDGKFQEATVTTDEDGTAAIEWAPDVTVHKLWFTARKPKLVPIHILWDDERHPLRLPPMKELRFKPGTTIGGIVQDEAGHPIEGATVDVHAPPTEYEGRNYVFTLGSPRTDAQGRWRLDVAPKDLDEVWAAVTHPHYKRNGGAASRKLDSVTVLKKGLSVMGRVVDAAGRAVKGARAIMGRDTWGTNPPAGTTDGSGAFTLENCDLGPSIITVQAEGFAPRIHEVRVEERTPPVVIALTEPGSILRVRVVDVEGKPVAGASLGPDTWRGQRSIHFRGLTGPDGRVEWRSAPKDVVFYDIGKAEYMWSRLLPLTASEREQTVILYPKLAITGRVTDAATGRPVPSFRIVQGQRLEWRDAIHWSENLGADGTDGQYTSQFDEPSAALFVRVEAPGYKSVQSRAFQSNEGRQTFNFALHRATGLSGIVLLPDGKPAEGAEVALSRDTQEGRVTLRLGRFDRDGNFPIVRTGPDGRFPLPPRDGPYLLIAVSDAGYADASSDEFAKSAKLVLQPWGRIEGGVRIGPRFGPDQEVTFRPIRLEGKGGIYGWNYNYTTRTDERGRFRFDRVIPGPGTVARVVVTEFAGGMTRHSPGWPESVEVKPGETIQVTIGGKGRPVIGRLVLDGTPESPVDWTRNEPAEITIPGGWLASNIDKDGRFRIEDVRAGKYELKVSVNAPPGPRFKGSGTLIGRLQMPFTVPEMPGGRSNEPLDLGTITVPLFDALKVGDLAPDFDVERIGTQEKGRRLKLGDHRGKLVLLNFWDASDRQDDMTILKEVQETFGSDPRFVLISLTWGQDVAQAEKSIKEKGLSWTHGFAGDFASGVAPRYKIRAIQPSNFFGPDQRLRRIPLTFLIGPDGRILAHDLQGTELEAVRKALENPKLFAVGTGMTPGPARFPVTQHAVHDEKPAGMPSVVVLDDCDGNFERGRPHHDGLRILHVSPTPEGGYVKSIIKKEFNTCQTIGSIHCVALNAARGRIYVSEIAGNRVTALDVQGGKLWEVEKIEAGALAVDTKTGHLWCTVGHTLAIGQTVVFDRTGREVTSFPVRGVDIAYDPHTDGFWLVGDGITKLSRQGQELFHELRAGWAYVSVAMNPRDGSLWIVERAHPDVARSVNRLWHRDAKGGVIKTWDLGEKPIFGVACDPKTGTAWVTSLGTDLLRFTADGNELPPLPVKARAIAISPATGQVWLTTETDIVRLDGSDRLHTVSRFGATSGQSWLAVF